MGAETDSTTVVLVDPPTEQHDEPPAPSPDAWIWDGVMDLANAIEKVNGNPPVYPKVGRVPLRGREKCEIIGYAIAALVIMVVIGLGTAFFITMAVTTSRGTSIFDEPQVTFHGLNGDGQPYMTHRFTLRDVPRLVCVNGCDSAPHYFPGFDAVQCTLEVGTDPKKEDYEALITTGTESMGYVLLPTGRLVQWYEGTPVVSYAAWRCEWPKVWGVHINSHASEIVCDTPAGREHDRRVWTQTCALYYSVGFD